MAHLSIIGDAQSGKKALVVHGLTEAELTQESTATAEWSRLSRDLGLTGGGVLTSLTFDNALAAEERAAFPQLFVDAVADEDERLDDLDAGLVIVAEEDEPLTIVYQETPYRALVEDLKAHFADEDNPVQHVAEVLDTLQLHGIDVDVKPDEEEPA